MLPETLKEIYCKLSDKIKNHLVYYYNAVLLLMKINAITLLEIMLQLSSDTEIIEGSLLPVKRNTLVSLLFKFLLGKPLRYADLCVSRKAAD